MKRKERRPREKKERQKDDDKHDNEKVNAKQSRDKPKCHDSGKADIETWEKEETPIEDIDMCPRSEVDAPGKVASQNAKLQELDSEAEHYLHSHHAIDPSGRTAPPIPISDQEKIRQDAVDSSALPMSYYDAVWTSGGIRAKVQEAEDARDQTEHVDRVIREKRTDEQIEEEMSRFMVLKGQRLDLPWWNPETFPIDGTCVAYGRRRSGKSWIVRELLHLHRGRYRGCIVITNTEQNDFWSKHVPYKLIHTYSQFLIKEILMEQRGIIAENSLYSDNPYMQKNPYLALVLDDVVGQNMHHDPWIKELFYMGRHYSIAVFITSQHPRALPPGVRANADLVFVFPQHSTNDQDSIREQYVNFFQDKRDWYLALAEFTMDHQCIVLDIGDPTKPMLDNLYTYKADDPGPFLLGARELWEDDAKYRRERLLEMIDATKRNKNAPMQEGTEPDYYYGPEMGSNDWLTGYLFS